MTEDIICLKCGKHFNGIESARDHNCKASKEGPIYFIPSITFISGTEIREALKSGDKKGNPSIPNICPLNLDMQSFPCPHCIHSESVSERKKFFNVTAWWYCKYPEVVNLTTKMRMIKEKETDDHIKHLSKAVWDCPSCNQSDKVRFDIEKQVFVCWNCTKRWIFEEGIKLFDGFEWYNQQKPD
jgi:hypothetical protein